MIKESTSRRDGGMAEWRNGKTDITASCAITSLRHHVLTSLAVIAGRPSGPAPDVKSAAARGVAVEQFFHTSKHIRNHFGRRQIGDTEMLL